MPSVVNRGEVYWTTLPAEQGSAQYGYRPVIIVSNDKFNQDARWRTVIVVAVTRSQSLQNMGTVVALPKGIAHLPDDSFALCHQLFVLDKNTLTNLIGMLPNNYLRDLEAALKVAIYLK
jgi:mRNA interferase MazF